MCITDDIGLIKENYVLRQRSEHVPPGIIRVDNVSLVHMGTARNNPVQRENTGREVALHEVYLLL